MHLKNLRDADPTWDLARCDALISELEATVGLRFERGRSWPKASIAPLADPDNRQRFVAIIDEVERGLSSRADGS
jgi:hypothetical protein